MRWLAALVFLALPAPAAAQGWIEPLPRVGPHLQRVERVRTSVTVRVTDRVARVEVEDWFRNAGGGIAEGDYIYPLAGEAVFSDFSLFQGEEELKGETMEASRARAIYEEIVRRRRDPALIEMAGHGLLRARVFPFGPGETRNVRLRYTQVLDRAGDALRFRYVAGTARTAVTAVLPERQTLPAAGSDAPLTFTLVAENGARFAEPFSPTDRLRVSRDRDRLTVRPAESPRGSFDIFLPLAVPGVGVSLATHRVNGEDGYFMLTLSPGVVKAAPDPRDIAVVVDTSGSMSGAKIEQAREAIGQLLGTLNAKDRFRLVSFGNQVQAHRPEWADANRANVDEARAWVDRIAANGGTNIAGALDEAFRTPAGAGRLHLVIVITDGQPTVGETDPERIAARVEAGRGQARIFTFGVGHDLNTYLLDRMAVAGRGTVDYVEPGRPVEEVVGALANRIRLPVLVDLAFAGTPVRLRDVQPSRLPDLYAGQELVVFGRYESAGTAAGELAIEGRRGGRPERFAARVEFPAHASSGEYIPGLWAARKVGELTRSMRLEGATPARIAEIRELALRYGLLTEYTSYLVQEPLLGLAATAGGRAGGGGARGAMAQAAPPAAASGEAAVTSARQTSRMLGASTQADLDAVQGQVAAEAPAVDVQNARQQVVDGMRVNPGRADRRIVAGRTFQLDAGVWVDTGHTARSQVVAFEPFSAAYFAVLARLPELAPYWGTFESVTVAGRQVSIRVAPGGRSTLAAGELETLVRNFR